MPLKALLFDFDGLILDTEFPIYEAWREDYLAHGHELPLDVYAACVGRAYAASCQPNACITSAARRCVATPKS